MPAQGGEVLVGWGTRQKTPGVTCVTCLQPPAWKSYSMMEDGEDKWSNPGFLKELEPVLCTQLGEADDSL